MSQPHAATLHRGLKNRHIQLIALGGSIGTGLFLGIAQTINMAGPSAILGYAIAGLIAFLIMRQLGEMVVEEPVSGTFSHFANRYWGPFAGFMSGWNYWVLYVLVGMAELTAVGLYVQYWWPGIPTWVSAAVCFTLITLINLSHVKLYGEVEFWFSLIKVVAIVSMIGFGSCETGLERLSGFLQRRLEGCVLSSKLLELCLDLFKLSSFGVGGRELLLMFALR